MRVVSILLLVLLWVAQAAQAADRFPDSRNYDPAINLYDQARYYFDNGFYLAAALQFDKCAKQFPQHSIALQAKYQVGVSYEQLMRYHDADYVFTKLWEESPWFADKSVLPSIFFYWIKTKISLGQIDAAEKLYATLRMSNPDKKFLSEATFLIAEHFYLSNQKDLAYIYLNNGNIQDAELAFANYLQGIIALENENQDLAELYFKKVIDFPSDFRYDLDELGMIKDKASYKLALLKFNNGKYQEAAEYYKTLANEALYGADKALGLAWCYFQLENYPLVNDCLSKIFQDYSNYRALSEALFLAGVSAFHTENYPAAVMYFEQFLDIFDGYETEEVINQRIKSLSEEQKKILALQEELTEIEKKLVNLDQSQLPHFIDIIITKRNELTQDLALVQKMINTLNQRLSELPLRVEAEYGIAKAKLKQNLSGFEKQ